MYTIFIAQNIFIYKQVRHQVKWDFEQLNYQKDQYKKRQGSKVMNHAQNSKRVNQKKYTKVQIRKVLKTEAEQQPKGIRGYSKQKSIEKISSISFNNNPVIEHTYISLPKIYGIQQQKREKKMNNDHKTKINESIKCEQNELKQCLCHRELSELSQENEKKNIQNLDFEKTPPRNLQSPKLQNNLKLLERLSKNIESSIKEIRETVKSTVRPKNSSNKKESNQKLLDQYYNIRINHLPSSRIKQETTEFQGQTIKKTVRQLEKPKEQCQSKYCSCNSFYHQYVGEIHQFQSQLKAKLQKSLAHRRNNQSLQCKLQNVQKNGVLTSQRNSLHIQRNIVKSEFDLCAYCRSQKFHSSNDNYNSLRSLQPTNKNNSINDQKKRKGLRSDYKSRYQLNSKNEEVEQRNKDQKISTKFLAERISKALQYAYLDKNDRKQTIFSKLNKQQQSDDESITQNDLINSRTQNRRKKKFKFVGQNDLFTIPEQNQYVDYLKSYKPILINFKIKDLVKSDNFKILKSQNSVYFGQLQMNNVKNGKAIEVTPKQIFEGTYEKGIKTSGCERNIDGVYIGQFLNEKRHGKGKFLWNNGEAFEGEWKLGTKNGFGKWTSLKGDYYEGQWKLNRQHGKGVYKHKNSVFTGQFKDFLKCGSGTQNFINGDNYKGQYLNGRPHGKGTYCWKDGSQYQGQFVNGVRQGYGKWHYNENAFYEGQFKKDFKHGRGKQRYKNGDSFEGQFRQNKKWRGVFKNILTGQEIIITDTNQMKNSK